MFKNKDCIKSSPVLLSFQLSSPETPILFHSLNPALSSELQGKREVWSQTQQRSSPPAWGLLPLSKKEDHSPGGTDLEYGWALHAFLQEEGVDMHTPQQPCPHLEERPQAQPRLLHMCFS